MKYTLRPWSTGGVARVLLTKHLNLGVWLPPLRSAAVEQQLATWDLPCPNYVAILRGENPVGVGHVHWRTCEEHPYTSQTPRNSRARTPRSGHVPGPVMSPVRSCPRSGHVPGPVMSPVRSCHVMSCPWSCHVPGPFMSCPRSSHVMSPVRSCHVPGPVMSCPQSGHVMSPVRSCPRSCHVMSPVMSCHALSSCSSLLCTSGDFLMLNWKT